MADSISNASDAGLLVLAQNVFMAISESPGEYAVTPIELTAFSDLIDSYGLKLGHHTAAQTAALAKTAEKDAERDLLERALRARKNAAKTGGASEAKIAALGITSTAQPAPEVATVPVGNVDTSIRLQHTIHFSDSGAVGNKKKPRGVVGCEIWVKLDGPPPTDVKECTFIALDTITPYIVEYTGADSGKMAHYMLRWAMRDSTKRGWGETVSATITG